MIPEDPHGMTVYQFASMRYSSIPVYLYAVIPVCQYTGLVGSFLVPRGLVRYTRLVQSGRLYLAGYSWHPVWYLVQSARSGQEVFKTTFTRNDHLLFSCKHQSKWLAPIYWQPQSDNAYKAPTSIPIRAEHTDDRRDGPCAAEHRFKMGVSKTLKAA